MRIESHKHFSSVCGFLSCLLLVSFAYFSTYLTCGKVLHDCYVIRGFRFKALAVVFIPAAWLEANATCHIVMIYSSQVGEPYSYGVEPFWHDPIEIRFEPKPSEVRAPVVGDH